MAVSTSSPPLKIFNLTDDVFTSFKLYVGPVIGSGMTGDVVLATIQNNPLAKLAVKKFSLLMGDEVLTNKRRFLHEVSTLQELDHPNVVQHVISARCPDYLAICTKFCSYGTLTSRLAPLTELHVCMYLTQLTCALLYLHQKKIIHCDVKPSNVFLRNEYQVVLGDLGLALRVADYQMLVSSGEVGGTEPFKAPELQLEEMVDPSKLDVYSLGTTLRCMVLKRRLHVEEEYDDFHEAVLTCSGNIPFLLRWCLMVMLQPLPESRISVSSLLDGISLHVDINAML